AEGLPVRLLGRRHDLPELLAAADLLVLPAGTGSCAVLAHEARYARVLLVAPDEPGVPELVGDAAEFFPPDDAEALAAAVVRLLTDPARRKLLKDRAEAHLAHCPTEDQTVAQVLSVYDELTHRPASGAGQGATRR